MKTDENPDNSQIRKRGWGLFELLCFVAAASLVLPTACWVGLHYFPHHPRAAVFSIMLTVYPVLGFTFCILMHRFFRWDYKRRHPVGGAQGESK